MRKFTLLSLPLGLLLTLFVFLQTAQPAKLPPERAGKIDAPLGQIAFIRSGSLWIMDWDGKKQFEVVTAENADGGISWAPDGKRIAFARKGRAELKGPDGLGGYHNVYDVFIAFLDSAKAGNKFWWNRVTGDMGGRFPHWTADGNQIIFTNDLNANKVDPIEPNYQTCIVDVPGGEIRSLREDYQNTPFNVLMPTIGPNNEYAFVLKNRYDPKGVGICPLDKKTISEKDLGVSVKLVPGAAAPAWSPDGKWLAYVESDLTKQGIYITTPDLSEKFLVYKPTVGKNLQTYPLSWSPNSKWIAFGLSDGSLWIIDITGNGLKQLTGPGLNLNPVWSKHE